MPAAVQARLGRLRVGSAYQSQGACALMSVGRHLHAISHRAPVDREAARIEFLDDVQMDACIRYSKLKGLAAKPTLFFEFHGSEAGVAEQAAQMQAIAEEHGGSAFEWARAGTWGGV